VKAMLILPIGENGKILLDATVIKELFTIHHGFAPTEHDEVRICVQEPTDFQFNYEENQSFISYVKN